MKWLAALLLSVLAITPAHADITLAVAGPYTGQVASIGQAQQAGVTQAVEDINAAGGIQGKQITLKIYDDACDPKQAVAIANKIISDELSLVLHGSCSGASLAAQKVYADEGALVINSVSSSARITDEGGPRLFRAMYRDDSAASVLSHYIVKHYKNAKIAILHDKTTYGQGVAEDVRDKINKVGVRETLFESYDPNNHDYSVLVARLKQAGVAAVFIGGIPVSAGLITRQLHAIDAKVQIIGGDLGDQDYWKIAGETGNGALFASPRDPRKAVGAKETIEKLQKTGVTVDGYTLYGYAAVQVLAQAITKAGDNDPAKLADILHRETFDTILGKWNFDAKGDVPTIHLVMYRWHDGQFAEIKEERP